MKSRTHWILFLLALVLVGMAVTMGLGRLWNAHGIAGNRRDCEPLTSRTNESKEQSAADIEEFRKAVREQTEKLEASRKVLCNIVRNDNARRILPWNDSVDGIPGDDADQRNGLIEKARQLVQKMDQTAGQISKLHEYRGETQMAYAAGLDVANNRIRITYPKYVEAKRRMEEMKISGLAYRHPALLGVADEIANMERQLTDGLDPLIKEMDALLKVTSNELESARDALAKDRYVKAKATYETEDAKFKLLQTKLQNLTTANESEQPTHLRANVE